MFFLCDIFLVLVKAEQLNNKKLIDLVSPQTRYREFVSLVLSILTPEDKQAIKLPSGRANFEEVADIMLHAAVSPKVFDFSWFKFERAISRQGLYINTETSELILNIMLREGLLVSAGEDLFTMNDSTKNVLYKIFEDAPVG